MPRRNRPTHRGRLRGRSRRSQLARTAEAALERDGKLPDGWEARTSRVRRTAGPTSDASAILCPRGKVGYSSEAKALERMAELRSKPEQPNRPRPVRVYKCEHCPGWHMTARATPPKRVTDAERRDG